MKTIKINQSEYHSLENAIAETLYDKFKQTDWTPLNYMNTCGKATYGMTKENGIRFNFWVEEDVILLEVTELDFDCGYVGRVLTITQVPYITSRLYLGSGQTVYTADAVDPLGNQYSITWIPVENYHDLEDASDHCNWEEPDEITDCYGREYNKCSCGSICLTESNFVEGCPYCRDCFERLIQRLVEEQNLSKLTSCFSSGKISTLGVKYAYLHGLKGIGYVNCHFNVSEVSELNPRIDQGRLLLDLWFNKELTEDICILDNRIVNGIHQVKQTVAINELDYVSTVNNKRYYW